MDSIYFETWLHSIYPTDYVFYCKTNFNIPISVLRGYSAKLDVLL